MSGVLTQKVYATQTVSFENYHAKLNKKFWSREPEYAVLVYFNFIRVAPDHINSYRRHVGDVIWYQ